MNRVDAVWAIGRVTLQPLTRLFVPLRTYGVERIPRTGGVVLAFNHFHWIDPPVDGRRLAAHRPLPREGRGAPRAGARPADPQLRDDLRPPRRVGSRGGAADARGRARRPRARALRRRDAAAAAVFRVECSRVRRWSRSRRTCRSSRPRFTARTSWRLGNCAPVSVAWGEPCASRGCRRAARATARRRRRSSGGSTGSTTGSPRSTRSGGRVEAVPPA